MSWLQPEGLDTIDTDEECLSNSPLDKHLKMQIILNIGRQGGTGLRILFIFVYSYNGGLLG